MKHVKVLETTLDIADPISACSYDQTPFLISALRRMFVKKNYKGGYITDILEILNTSEYDLVKTNLSGGATIHVRFTASVVVFSEWDILVGVRLIRRERHIMGKFGSAADPKSGEALVCVMCMNSSRNCDALDVGQTISVRILQASHPPMESISTVLGTLFTCDQTAKVYRLAGSLTPQGCVGLSPLLDAIEIELRLREPAADERRADLWFHELLLNSYTADGAKHGSDGAYQITTWPDAPAWVGPPFPDGPAEIGAAPGRPANILDILYRVVRKRETVPVSGYWTRPLTYHRSSPLAAVSPEPVAKWGEEALAGDATIVFADFAKNILDWLAAIRGHLDTYNTKAMIDSHMSLWGAMRSTQKRLPA